MEGGIIIWKKNFDRLNLWVVGGGKGGSAIVLTFRKYFFESTPNWMMFFLAHIDIELF